MVGFCKVGEINSLGYVWRASMVHIQLHITQNTTFATAKGVGNIPIPLDPKKFT